MRRELSVWRGPFGTMHPWRHDLESVVNDFFSSRGWPGVRTGMPSEASFRIDSYVADNRLHIKADLPVVEPQDVEIALDGNRLTVKGERKAEHEDKNGGYFHQERSYGSFARSFILPKDIDAEKIEASAKNGTLEVVVPFPEEVKPRRIPIDVKPEIATDAASD